MRIELKMGWYDSGWLSIIPANEMITNYINTAIPRTIKSTHVFPWSVEMYVSLEELESISENLKSLGVEKIEIIRR